ncbi:MAG: hypothetical protein EBS05_07755, partial [Proteobacteria bacterium]|nr:hypothetical protein [Pseudomonadota bacterium]
MRSRAGTESRVQAAKRTDAFYQLRELLGKMQRVVAFARSRSATAYHVPQASSPASYRGVPPRVPAGGETPPELAGEDA